MAIDKKVPEENEENFRITDQRTDDRIHHLLSDPNDEVTEDDIRNVRTDFGTSATSPAPQAPLQEDTSKAAEEIKPKDPDDPGIQTTWNILKD